jgi:hypothetical protein
MVVWEDSGTSQGREWDINGAIVTPAGAVSTRFPIVGGTAWQLAPSIGFDGTNALVAWDHRSSGFNHVYAARVTPAGTVLPGGPVRVLDTSGDSSSSAVAFGGGNFLVVGTHFRLDSGDEVHAARVSPEGARVDAAPGGLSRGAPAQVSARVAWAGDRALVVWSAWDGVFWDIQGLRFDAAGRPLDAEPFVISDALFNQTEPDVVSDGTDFLVVWNDDRNDFSGFERDIHGARVTAAGEVQDPQGIPIAAGGSLYRRRSPLVAFNGQSYVVGWWGSGSVLVARVSREGTAGPEVTVGSTDNEATFGLACTGAGTCATVFPVTNGSRRPLGLYRLDASLAKLDTSPIYVSDATESSELASLVFDGTHYVAAWTYWLSGDSYSLHAGRFTPTGTRLDATPLDVAPGEEVRHPRLASDGRVVVLTWQQRSGNDWRAMARELGLNLVGPPAFPLPVQPVAARAPSVALSPAGLTAVVWEQFDEGLGAMRVRARLGTARGALGSPCSTGNECSSGFCADGVCCDSACGGGTSDCLACSVAAGARTDGTCEPRPELAVCDDGNGCTRTDTCQAGQCVGADAVVCSAETCRAAGSCDPGTGACRPGAVLAGAVCDDGQACTADDRCGATATCAGSPRTPPQPGDCEVVSPVCSPDGGTFPVSQAPDGTACSVGQCRSGVCVPSGGPDGGTDGGTPGAPDAGTAPELPPSESGCGCGAGTGAPAAPLLLLAAWAAARRRREWPDRPRGVPPQQAR